VKSAAEERMFPAFFARVTESDAPVVGMLVMAIVQSLMALCTISPTLSEQFSALVNLAVVTNVIPYIISLSALIVMMQRARVPQGSYRINVAVTVVAMLYSTYAIYASGMSAVLGGTIVMALGFVIYGFLAPRFDLGKEAAREVHPEPPRGPGLPQEEPTRREPPYTEREEHVFPTPDRHH